MISENRPRMDYRLLFCLERVLTPCTLLSLRSLNNEIYAKRLHFNGLSGLMKVHFQRVCSFMTYAVIYVDVTS